MQKNWDRNTASNPLKKVYWPSVGCGYEGKLRKNSWQEDNRRLLQRERRATRRSEIFLVFDDGTYFEIYSGGDPYCTVRGAQGLDKGDITKLRKLNHNRGKVAFDAHISLATTEHMRERIKQTLLYDCEYALKSFSQGFLSEAKESLQDLATNAKLYKEYLPDNLVEDIHDLKEYVAERLADEEPATAVVSWVWDMFVRLKNLPT